MQEPLYAPKPLCTLSPCLLITMNLTDITVDTTGVIMEDIMVIPTTEDITEVTMVAVTAWSA